VVVLDRNQAALDVLVGQMTDGLSGVQTDVSDGASVAEAFVEVERRLGGVDVVLANAGISYRTPFLDISSEQWHRVLATNLDGVFYTSQEAARRMVQSNGGGVILMTASTNGMTGHPLYADYNVSKAGVIALARTMALELAPLVRVSAVCPGYVLTPMQAAEYTPEMMDQVNSRIPLRRHASVDEVAALFAFLASDEAAYMTGQPIVIDGGELA
jgi:NAD(P)-dependent dehydrogenase (short-subunit alcohol dehydrogenase family)